MQALRHMLLLYMRGVQQHGICVYLYSKGIVRMGYPISWVVWAGPAVPRVTNLKNPKLPYISNIMDERSSTGDCSGTATTAGFIFTWPTLGWGDPYFRAAV